MTTTLPSAAPVALQRIDRFVGRTMNWFYDHMRFVPRHRPVVICDALENRAEFPELDAIVLDPPKLAPTAAHAERAARAYKDINRLAFKLLTPGGVLFTYSCSGGISADLFHKIVASAGLDAGVDGFISERLGGAPDHPMTVQFPEGEYLKGLIVMRKPGDTEHGLR